MFKKVIIPALLALTLTTSNTAEAQSLSKFDAMRVPNRCASADKGKCRAEADRRWEASDKGWCMRDGVNVCREKILDDAATCLSACGDVGAFERRGTLYRRDRTSPSVDTGSDIVRTR
jgi:hypothetical protein